MISKVLITPSPYSRLMIAVIGLLFFLASCKSQNQEKHLKVQKPNIVLILTDDQGWGDLSVSGNINLSTPHIDALAKNGTSFTNFYVQPVCSPTRAELLTGRYYPRTGVYATSSGGERMDAGETTIADVFKKAGYKTAVYGKWHNGMQPPYHPNARGFDDFYGFASGHWGNYFSPMLEHNGEIVRGEGFLPDDLTNKGMVFMEQHRNEPFFLYLPYNTPHSPMQVPEEFYERFENWEPEMRHRGTEAEETEFTRAALAMVENLDYNVGRLKNKIQELGLAKNTIVVFLSDNGPNNWRWNAGMRGKKGWVDEGGVRSPFFIKWEDSIPAGKEVKKIASAIDILPTLADLAKIEYNTAHSLDGKSLKPLLFQENPEWPDRLVYNHWNGETSVRSQDHRLDDENRLYDISTDRSQTKDIAMEKPGIRDSLIWAKKQWLDEVRPELSARQDRPFTLGHPDVEYTQLPARDGIPHGNIERSNRYPNDSFFRNWTSTKDSITWDVEVLENGLFEVQLFYTAKEENLGAIIQLGFKDNELTTKITEAHDPPLEGMENDRVPRLESYVKDFKPMDLGTMELKKGRGSLSLKALEIAGEEVMEVRLLIFKKLDQK